MDNFGLSEQKQTLMEALLPLCPFVLIDAAQPSVQVPPFLARADLVLRLGRDPKVMGIPDLELTETGFSATISVRGARHFVSVPWTACSRIWVGDPFRGPMVVWPDVAEPKPKQAPPRPGLRLVKS